MADDAHSLGTMRRSTCARWVSIVCAACLWTACQSAGTPNGDSPSRIDLGSHARSVFSQFGEDGVIEKIFEIIEPTERYVIAFGAHDGITNSNARNLVLNHGWGGLLIEGNPHRAKKLHAAYAEYPGVTTLESWVFPGNIELLFEDAGAPLEPDLLVIDIDSNDYYVWRAIRDYRPKVVMIETHPQFPPPQLMVIDFHPMNYWDGDAYVGASIQSLYELGKKKGYELIHCMAGLSPNAFFVDAQYYERFGIEDNAPEAIWPAPLSLAANPTAIAPDKRFLVWKKIQIEKKFILDKR